MVAWSTSDWERGGEPSFELIDGGGSFGGCWRLEMKVGAGVNMNEEIVKSKFDTFNVPKYINLGKF